MDNVKLQYVIEILKQGDGGQKAVQELEKLQQAGDKTGTALDSLAKKAEAFLSIWTVEHFLEDSARVFLENEKAVARLDAALATTGQRSDAVKKQFIELSKSLENLTTFDGKDILGVIAPLVAFGAPEQGVPRLTEAVLDLSTLMDKNLPRATQAMARALKGEFGAFTELGFKFEETATAAEKLNSALQQIDKVAGGQARAAKDTLGGKIDDAQKRFKDLQNSIGEMATEGVVNVLPLFDRLFDPKKFEENKGHIEGITKAHAELRAQIEAEIDTQERLGTMSRKAADDMRASLEFAFQQKVTTSSPIIGSALGVPNLKTTAPDLAAQRKALLDIGPRMGVLPKEPAKGDIGPIAPNEAEQKAAVIQLGELKKQIALDSVQDLEKERMQAGFNYGERLKQIQEQAKLAGTSAEQKSALEEDLAKSYLAQMDQISQKETAMRDKRSLEDQNEYQQSLALETQLKDAKLAIQLKGDDLIILQNRQNHETRVAQIAELRDRDQDRYFNLMELEAELTAAEEERFQKTQTFNGRMEAGFKQLGQVAREQFASGAASAIVDAFSQGDQAFQKFASNFLKLIAQMILQQLILNAIQGVFGGAKAASGGSYRAMAAGGIAGVDSINQATFFPQFNVLAGEAGPEVMTVMANPSMASIGGILAQVGMVKGRKLAIVDAAQLAGLSTRRLAAGGMEGPNLSVSSASPGSSPGEDNRSVVEISLSPGLEANMVKKAVSGSVIEVTHQLYRDTPIARAARQLNS
jgi:hypothetical protein